MFTETVSFCNLVFNLCRKKKSKKVNSNKKNANKKLWLTINISRTLEKIQMNIVWHCICVIHCINFMGCSLRFGDNDRQIAMQSLCTYDQTKNAQIMARNKINNEVNSCKLEIEKFYESQATQITLLYQWRLSQLLFIILIIWFFSSLVPFSSRPRCIYILFVYKINSI